MSSIRILVVDDHELVRRSICKLLIAEPDFDVVSEATTGYEAVRKAEEHRPSVVLLDIGLPELNGLLAAPLIKRVAPEAEILMITNHDNVFFVREAFSAGARGFLSKSDLSSELIAAVRDVHSKKEFIGSNLRDLVNGNLRDFVNHTPEPIL